jgi:hypothetical protein
MPSDQSLDSNLRDVSPFEKLSATCAIISTHGSKIRRNATLSPPNRPMRAAKAATRAYFCWYVYVQ